MTLTGGFPAPGPQDGDQHHNLHKGWGGAPPPTGPAVPVPQIPTLTAHKPGIVPLRPLQFGDILDGAVKAVRFNPKAMVGLSAIVLTAFLVPSAALGIGATHLSTEPLRKLGPAGEIFLGIPSAVAQSLTTTLVTGLLSGLLMQVVGQAVLGRKPSLGQTWRSTRGRLPTLLALTLLSLLFSLLAMGALLVPGALLLANNNIAGGIGLLFLGFLGLIAVSLFVSTKISMAAPAIVLEGHGLGAGLRRSFALTRGGAFWRILGITLVAGLLAGLVGALLGAPFSVIGVLVTLFLGLQGESAQMVATFVAQVSAVLTGAITTPFMAAVTGLLYIDRRMRLEALDVVLLREAQTNPAPQI
jgi:hypothetical protein